MESELKKEMQLVKQPPLTFTEIVSIANAFSASGMFPDIKTAAQAIVKIQAGQEIGIKPFAAMTGIHIIAGKCVPGAGIIASRVKANGRYDYKVVEMTDKICSLDFFQGKEFLGNSTFTIEDAKKAETKNIGKFPKNMLFARAISNGAKWYTPDVFDMPVYTAEEMDFATEDTKAEVMPKIDKDQQSIKPDSFTAAPEAEHELLKGGKTELQEDPAPFQIPGHWYAKMDKCRTKADVLAVYQANKETIDAHPELQKLLKDTQTKFNNLQAA